MEIAFLIDSSASIGEIDYKKEKDFIKLLASSFHLSPSHSRAAIIMSSDSVSLKVGFDQHTDIGTFKSAVENLPYKKGNTQIDKALEVAHSELFVKARSGLPKIAIVLTDGRQTPAPDPKSLKDASESLRRAGVRILAVGIGDVDSSNLRLMTDSDNDVFLAKDFDDLKLKFREIADGACAIAANLLPSILINSSETIAKVGELVRFLDTVSTSSLLIMVVVLFSYYNYYSFLF